MPFTEIVDRFLRGEEISLPIAQIVETLAALQPAAPPERRAVVVQMSNPALIDQIALTLRELAQTEPCFAMMLVLNPHSEEDELTATVTALLTQHEGRSIVNGEQFLLVAGGASVEHAVPIALPLLHNDIPLCYWLVQGIPADTPLLEQLRTRTPVVIIDSSQTEDLGITLARANALLEENTRLSDLNWARLAPWRVVLEEALSQPQFHELEKISFTLGGAVLDENHLGQPVLLLSWLAHRLGWELLETLDYAQGRFRVVWEKEGREIVAEIKTKADAPTELHAIELCAHFAESPATAQLELQAGASDSSVRIVATYAKQTARQHEFQMPALAELLRQELERQTNAADYGVILALATKLI